MKEAAKTGLRSDRRVEKTSALKQGCQQLQRTCPGRDTNFWHQRPNNIIEAYTGNDIGHKGDRTPRRLDIAP